METYKVTRGGSLHTIQNHGHGIINCDCKGYTYHSRCWAIDYIKLCELLGKLPPAEVRPEAAAEAAAAAAAARFSEVREATFKALRESST